MEALRRMRPPAKGATPVSDPDSMLPCGHHVNAMLVACYGTLAAGTALGFASAAMASIERQSWYDLPRVPPQNRWIADSLFLGAIMGALSSGLVLHMVGYRTSMLLSSAGLISSWICMALGSSVSMVLVGRVACGLFVGVAANCACLYIADVAPPAKRSTYGGLPEVATSAGILTAYLMAGFPWEVQAGGCALAAIPTLALQRYIIENPRWLLAQDRFLDADTAVMRLYGVDPPAEFRQHKGNEPTQQQGTAASYRWPKETRSTKSSRHSLPARQPTAVSPQMSPSLEVQSTSPPFNAAMEALRRLKHAAKGATPVTDQDSVLPCGHHARAMMLACSSALAAGMALGFASAAMPAIENRYRLDLPHGPPDNRWIADSLFLGATVGALLSGFLLYLVGHRRTLLLCSCGLISFCVCLMVSNKVSMIMVSRVACGIVVGVITNCVCLYVADVAPPAKRTTYGGLIEVAMSAGVLGAYTLAGFAWQQQAAGCAMASMPVLALHRYVVENPRWLMSKGLSLDAHTAVMRLYGVDPPPDFRDRKAEAVQEQQMSATSKRVWPKHASMVSTCFLLHLLQNISGAQLCLLRAIQVMGTTVAEIAPQPLAAVLVAAHFGCASLAAALTKAASRHTLLAASAFAVAGVVFIFRPLEHLTFTHWYVPEKSHPTSWGAVLSVGLLVLAYSVGLCHLPALLTGELMPSKIRLLGSSVVWSSRWLVTFLLLHFDVDVLAVLQQRGPLLALSLTIVVVAATAIVLIPETEGQTLAQIERGQLTHVQA
ncbi:solute carrier family 2, facilitated glucose transporter member 8-like isoform X2 [Dermacentor albipictus]